MYVEHPYKFNDKFYAKVDGKFYEITREVAKAMLSAYRNEVYRSKKCYTVKDLQEMLDVSRSTVYKLLRQNEFRWIQLEGGGYRISKKSFDEWLDKGNASVTS